MVNPIYKSKLEFSPFMKYFCTKNCMLQLLQYYKIQHAILYIKVGFNLEVIFSNSGFWVNSADALTPSASNVFLSQGYSDSFDESCELNKQQLLSGIPPIVLVDTYYLPYRKEYQKIHASHSAIFAGFDENSVCLIDCYPPHYFKGFIKNEVYKESRNSINPKDVNPFSGIPIMNYWYSIDIDKLADSLNDCISNTLSDVVKKTSDHEKILRREDALTYLYTYFIMHKNNKISDKKLIMRKLHDSLFVYQNASNLMVYYFETLKDLMRIPEEIMETLKKLNECLTQFNVLCMRGSISQNPSYYDDVGKLFLELIKNQAVYLKNMDIWLSSELFTKNKLEGIC